MSAFIKLNKQDAFVVPYTAHKLFTFSNQEEREAAGIELNRGEKSEELFNSGDTKTGSHFNKLLYRTTQQLYYSNYTSSIESGSFENYNQTTLHYTRSLGDTLAVVSIPRKYYGEYIKPGTFEFTSGSEFKIIDDGEGNLITSGSAVFASALISESVTETTIYTTSSEDIGYTDIPTSTQMNLGTNTTLGITAEWTLTQVRWPGASNTSPFYIDAGATQVSDITDPSILQHLSFPSPVELFSDDQGFISFVDYATADKTQFVFTSASISQSIEYIEIAPASSVTDGEMIGNIFYSHGIAVITRDDLAGRLQDQVFNSGSFQWNASHTLYQYEYRCKISETALNYSQNTTTTQSGSYGQVYDFVTGSYFQPYITTVGLYNDSNELIAVGKLAQPVPKSRYSDMTFVVKFDV